MSNVSTTRHISTSCCQSRLLRAKRETSRAATAPTLPRQTSAPIRSTPARAAGPAAEIPRSSSITSNLRPAQYGQPLAHRVLQTTTLAIVQDLVQRRLPNIEYRLAFEVVWL